MVGFTKKAIDLTIDDWERVERYNKCLEQLLKRRVLEVTATGNCLESKTAWKCAVLQQSLLHRITALASGCAGMWNEGNVVCSILAARALVETVTVSHYVGQELKRLKEEKNANAIDDLANEQLFSTRNEKIVSEGYGHLARSVLTYIDKFDKKINGVREAYDFLSEWCHPNGSGHLFTYGEINKETGTVTFKESATRVRGIQGHVVTCFMLILFTEPILTIFDEVMPFLAEFDAGQGPWILTPGNWQPPNKIPR
jgi:methyl-accepting chemotaxis protein